MQNEKSVEQMLTEAAQAKDTAPVMEYIHNHYDSWTQFPVMSWLIRNIDDDDYIIKICKELETLGRDVFFHPSGNRFLFDEPMGTALKCRRGAITEAITVAILRYHAPCITGYDHAIILATYLKDMNIARGYIRVCGTDFVHDPYLLFIILYKDNVEMMELCLSLGTDPNMRLNDGRTLYEAASSDEMRALLARHGAETRI